MPENEPTSFEGEVQREQVVKKDLVEKLEEKSAYLWRKGAEYRNKLAEWKKADEKTRGEKPLPTEEEEEGMKFQEFLDDAEEALIKSIRERQEEGIESAIEHVEKQLRERGLGNLGIEGADSETVAALIIWKIAREGRLPDYVRQQVAAKVAKIEGLEFIPIIDFIKREGLREIIREHLEVKPDGTEIKIDKMLVKKDELINLIRIDPELAVKIAIIIGKARRNKIEVNEYGRLPLPLEKINEDLGKLGIEEITSQESFITLKELAEGVIESIKNDEQKREIALAYITGIVVGNLSQQKPKGDLTQLRDSLQKLTKEGGKISVTEDVLLKVIARIQYGVEF